MAATYHMKFFHQELGHGDWGLEKMHDEAQGGHWHEMEFAGLVKERGGDCAETAARLKKQHTMGVRTFYSLRRKYALAGVVPSA